MGGPELAILLSYIGEKVLQVGYRLPIVILEVSPSERSMRLHGPVRHIIQRVIHLFIPHPRNISPDCHLSFQCIQVFHQWILHIHKPLPFIPFEVHNPPALVLEPLCLATAFVFVDDVATGVHEEAVVEGVVRFGDVSGGRGRSGEEGV